MEHLREIAKIIEWGIKGDAARVLAYSKQLIEKLCQTGEEKAAQRLESALNDTEPTVSTSRLEPAPRLPVDGESRLALADEENPQKEEYPVILDSATTQLVEEFISFVKKADELEAHGVGLSPSLIAYGPPGTGKTQLARHIAGCLQIPLVVARADTLISSYLGSTSKNLRLLFDHVGNRHCILFLDELDAYAKLRDDHQELGELKRVVVSLLQNLDNMNPNTILLAATNHEHLLDPAIWRRFTYKIPLKAPTNSEREKLFALFLGKFVNEEQINFLAEISETLTGSDIRDISKNAIRDSILQKQKQPDMEKLTWKVVLARLKQKIDIDNPTQESIRTIRALNPSVFSGKKLAEMFKTSTATISRNLRRAE